jgi:hypothetical protein
MKKDESILVVALEDGTRMLTLDGQDDGNPRYDQYQDS